LKPPVSYKPGPVPTDLPPSAQRYLTTELNRISALLQALMTVLTSDQSLMLESTDAPPANPTVGMIVYTKGLWDPGSGEGYYYYNSHGVWTPLG
jgi:hypothetical protein